MRFPALKRSILLTSISGLLGLSLVACGGNSSGTPVALTIDPAALSADCPQASAHVTVGGAEAVPTFTAAQGGSAAVKTFSVPNTVIAEIEAHCLSAQGADLGLHKRIVYGSNSSTQLKLTVGAPVSGDSTVYEDGGTGVMPSIR